MSGPFEFRIDQIDSGRVLVRLEALPQSIRNQLRPVITRLTEDLLAKVIAGEPVKTGRLRDLTHSYIDEETSQRRNFIRGRVRVLRSKNHNTAAAAGALEYGAHRAFTVGGYKRRQRGGRALRRGVLGKLYGSQGVRVSAYTRRANIQALRFLRNPAAAQLARARAEINAVLEEAMKEFR